MRFTLVLALLVASPLRAQTGGSYRLDSVNLKRRVIWGVECLDGAGGGLAFGGQDQVADDGRPHTRVLVDGQWLAIDASLRDNNPQQVFHDQTWWLRAEIKEVLALARQIYFKGLTPDEERARLTSRVHPRQTAVRQQLQDLTRQLADVPFARARLTSAFERWPTVSASVTSSMLQAMHEAQIECELAAESLDAEPAARAVDCGTRRKEESSGPGFPGLVYEPKSGLYVLFGGDHLDYLTNDTWVFDSKQRQWTMRHPDGAPPPRANHRLTATGDGLVTLTGGYTYTSNTDYLGGQHADWNDGTWTYDVAANRWTGGELTPANPRVYRSGPFHPNYYLQGDKPDAARFSDWLEQLPVNEWVTTDPPYRPRLNRDWGCARFDPDRDLMLRWSGGHSAHGGTDVPHFHFSMTGPRRGSRSR